MKTCCVDFMNKECKSLMGECGRCSTNDDAWDNLRYYEELKERGRIFILPGQEKGEHTMKGLMKQIELLAAEELNCANAKFSPFASAHEGYAVLLEEVEESADEMEAIKDQMACLWDKIKKDSDTAGEIEAIRRHAVRLAAESTQIVAMTDKFKAIKKKTASEIQLESLSRGAFSETRLRATGINFSELLRCYSTMAPDKVVTEGENNGQ